MAGALLALGLLATLKVTAEGTCPSAAAVEARLLPLLPEQALQQDLPAVRAYLSPIDELLRVEVRSEDGALLSVRDLQRAAPCADLAAAAAVVIASALLSAPRVQTPPQLAPLPPTPVPPPLALRPRPAFDVGLAVALAAADSGATAAGALVLHVRGGSRRLGARLAISAALPRQLPIGDAAAQWTRAQLEVGPCYRLRPGRLLVDVHVHAAAALLAVAGQGFAADYQSLGWDAGVGAGLRIGLPWRWALPWLGLSATGYVRPTDLLVDGLPQKYPLPRFDALLQLGFSAGRIP